MGVWRKGSRIGLKIRGLRDMWVRLPLPLLKIFENFSNLVLTNVITFDSIIIDRGARFKGLWNSTAIMVTLLTRW